MERIETPFFLNEGHRCAQAVMMSVLKKKFPDKVFTYDQLDLLTLHQDPNVTFPSQIAYGFKQLDVPFEYYAFTKGLEVAKMPELDRLLQKVYSGNIPNVDLESLRKSTDGLISCNNVIFTDKRPSLDLLIDEMSRGKIVLALVNWDIFNNRDNSNKGHYVILTGYSDNCLLYHDSGPVKAGPFKAVTKKDFDKSRTFFYPIDHGLIVV